MLSLRMRVWLIIGLILASLLVGAGFLAAGEPERTPVPAIELRGETTDVKTTESRQEPRKRRSRENGTAGGGGSGATPAPVPPPAPAADDVDDDRDDDRDDEQDDGDDGD